MNTHLKNIEEGYDTLSQEYADRIFNELENKPLDRELLDRFAGLIKAKGRVCDVGCGPGHMARYLHERGVDVMGVDLSHKMAAIASHLSPGIDFVQANMLKLAF